MSLSKDKKKKVIGDFKQNKLDTGSPEVQVALLTERINTLEEHFKSKTKDHHSRYGLIKMVGRRKRLLSYLNRESPERYQALITRLNLRK